MSNQVIRTTTTDVTTGGQADVETLAREFGSMEKLLDAHEAKLAPVEAEDLETPWTDIAGRLQVVVTPRQPDEDQVGQETRHNELVTQSQIRFPVA